MTVPRASSVVMGLIKLSLRSVANSAGMLRKEEDGPLKRLSNRLISLRSSFVIVIVNCRRSGLEILPPLSVYVS